MSTSVLGHWLAFATTALSIGYAGAKVTRLADEIARTTGVSGTWVGLLLLATVTSLPEMVTGLSAVTAAQAPNIAVGDALGSTVFNLLLLVLLDLAHRGDSIYVLASRAHLLSAAFGIVLIGTVGASILLERAQLLAPLAFIGIYTPLLILLYFVAMRAVFDYERPLPDAPVPQTAEPVDLAKLAWRFAVFAAIVAACGVALPFLGTRLAQDMGWSQSFVGTLFIAGATSLPEAAVTLSALRLGALDMAISNLLGSNLFDMLVIALDDAFYTPGPILALVAPVHALTALLAMMMNAVAIIGLVVRPRWRLMRSLGMVSLALLLLYMLQVYVLLTHRN